MNSLAFNTYTIFVFNNNIMTMTVFTNQKQLGKNNCNLFIKAINNTLNNYRIIHRLLI